MKYLAHYGPSLCVKFHGNLVYAASGPFLHSYDYHTGELKSRCRIFHRNKIHGICIGKDGALLLYGANSLSLVDLQAVNERTCLLEHEKTVNGWVISGEFSYSGDQVYLLTSYNKVIVCDKVGRPVTSKSLCEEKSILYSGSITVHSQDKVYVNAGTVMGGILLWDLYAEEMVHNLKGHEGSIFFVTESADGRYVASCSDDRSIRLWDLKTGELLSVGWGHTARIWNLKFFDNGNRIVSVSEDCTCRIWEIRQQRDSIDLIQQNVYEVHLTKNIWGVDVDRSGKKVVTAGNDGRIKVTDLGGQSGTEEEQKCYTIEEISGCTNVPMQKGEIIKGFEWFDFGLVAITSTGKIFLLSSTKDSWIYLTENDKFSSYSTTHGVSNENVIVFANNKSDLLLLKFSNDGERIVAKTEYHCSTLSKTTNCLIRKDSTSALLALLESPNPRDHLVCLKFSPSTLTHLDSYHFTKPANFVSTCMEVYQNFMLIGSRFSTLAIFDLMSTGTLPYVIRNVNPGDTTTSIKHVEDQGSSSLFSVTNRDGYYDIIKVNLTEDPSHKIIHSNKIVRGFLEGADFNDRGDFITYGFKSSLFYVYNETACFEVFSHICGGAHRQWKLCHDSKTYVLVYIKASDIYIKRFKKAAAPEALFAGIHGREIRDIAVQKHRKFNDGFLFCTASEDTTMKLMHVDPKSGRLTNYWTQRKHVSGLQRCQFINETLMISCSAREELFLWEVDAQTGGRRPYMTLRQTLPTSSGNPDLRIMDFDVKFDSKGENFVMATVYSDSAIKLWFYDRKESSFSLILRGHYKTCCLLNVLLEVLRDQLCLIASATDGHLVYYNISKRISFKINVDDDRLTFGDLKSCKSHLPDYDCRLRVHQSGIKTVDSVVRTNGDLVIYTGGDDNGLGITLASFNESTAKICARVADFQEKAAASTITSCNLIDNATKLLATSVDQTLRLWDVSEEKLVLVDSSYTTIADTGSSDCVAIDKSAQLALIGGVGLSVVQMS
ncbi:hypothetical protein HG536_0D03840 [Torulaspora globosa]|uniref:Anaphase-promoting complex subunit 4 WD40 domain-containing protein n=1 Tax=Torulaspora globosa TaxID=48254 RepID=A0A7G3ZH76_9SACH|nr:uncharacterized protein HG536_0D03840 [Torulaspora globosa]QLL32862.1 hypothetical protein HG536_0D03840 [Torulaspora globosa]